MNSKTKLSKLISATVIVIVLTILSLQIEAASGDLDTSFGIGGKVTTQTGYGDKIHAIDLQSDGKLVVAGSREFIGSWEKLGLVARYNPDGSLDGSFGIGGFATIAGHGGHATYFKAVAIQGDGKIVAAGHFSESGGCTGARLFVVRYNSDGTLDTTFGTNGVVEFLYYCFQDSNGYNNSIAIQNDGKIIVAGSSITQSNNFDFAAARLNTNGSLDTSFSLDGLATFSIGSGNEEAYSIAINPVSGKIVLAGYSYSSSTNNDFALIMLNSSGLFDWSFNGNGKVTTNTGGNDAAYSVAFQTNGKIIAGGRQSNGSNGTDFSLARYNANGTLDTGFGTGGKVATAFSAYYDSAFGIALQSDGKIVAAGYGADNNNLNTSYNFALARYNTNGTLDTTFSGDGKQMTDFNINTDIGQALAIQADGKILVAGYTWNGAYNEIAVARYLP